MIDINYNEIFEYRSGRLFWRIRPSARINIGDEAGSIRTNYNGKRYRQVGVNGRVLSMHRIIYEMHFGPIPIGMQIDHKDGDGLNNLIENIRLATSSENNRNHKIHRNNTSGLKGVCWDKKSRKWRANIRFDCKLIHLGLFNTKDEAYSAYCIAAEELHKDFHRVV